MKKSIVLFLVASIMFLFNFKTEAQSLDENTGQTHFGVAFGIGYVNPKSVNKSIKNYYGGDASIHLAINAEVNLGYFVTNEIEVKGALIAAAAFSQVEDKDMIGMSNNKVNFLTRLAPEIIGNYYFVQNSTNSFYAGAGVSYNKLALYIDSDEKDDSGNAPGLLLNIGMLTSKRRYLELKGNLIKDKYNFLNFSGISINYGIRF